MNTRPVRLPPWAAGASPTIRSRASGSPKPGTGRRPVVPRRERGDACRAPPARATRPGGGRRGTRRRRAVDRSRGESIRADGRLAPDHGQRPSTPAPAHHSRPPRPPRPDADDGHELPGRAPGLHLADEGREQASRGRRRLAPLKGKVDAVYASPLERTRETAAPIAKPLGLRVRASTAGCSSATSASGRARS